MISARPSINQDLEEEEEERFLCQDGSWNKENPFLSPPEMHCG